MSPHTGVPGAAAAAAHERHTFSKVSASCLHRVKIPGHWLSRIPSPIAISSPICTAYHRLSALRIIAHLRCISSSICTAYHRLSALHMIFLSALTFQNLMAYLQYHRLIPPSWWWPNFVNFRHSRVSQRSPRVLPCGKKFSKVLSAVTSYSNILGYWLTRVFAQVLISELEPQA